MDKVTGRGDRLGLDLGTTNSACCFFNRERNAFDFLKFDSQSMDFFPTMIAYRKDNDHIRYIGKAAERYRFSSKYDFYERFKLSMGQGAEKKNGREKSPMETARDFISEVIKKYEQKSGEQVTGIVMTVPDIWKNEEENKIAVDHLTEIYDQLGYEADENVAFESEPVSAAVYYCREVCRGKYRGHMVVVDYGGGTLDLTLCETGDGTNITVLRRCGDGGRDTGCAGAAFDDALTKRMIENNGLDSKEYEEGTSRFIALRSALETAKIASSETTTEALKGYYELYDKISGESYNDMPAFDLIDDRFGEFEIMASDVAETFARVNEKPLKEALDNIARYCHELDIDTKSQDHFRVLMVGGFSSLYCVESTVREVFESMDGVKDRRFDHGLRMDARSTAIAHGAAIIASGMAEVSYQCQSDIGFYYYDVFDEEEKTAALIRRDHPVKDYREPVYFGGVLKVSSLGRSSVIRLFFDDGSGKIPVKMDESLVQLCPNTDDPDNDYRIGLSMGKHQIPMIHIKDKYGNVRSESLNRIVEKISLRLAKKGGEQL